MRPLSQPPTRSASSRRCAWGSRSIRRRWFTFRSNWRTEKFLAKQVWQLYMTKNGSQKLEKVMRTSKWIFAVALLTAMSAAAQQAADSRPVAQPAAPDTTQPTQPASQAQPAPVQADQSQPAQQAPAPAQPT